MICQPCRDGHHAHDRWTATSGHPVGTDAGCPNIAGTVTDEHFGATDLACACDVAMPPLHQMPHCPTCRCEEAS